MATYIKTLTEGSDIVLPRTSASAVILLDNSSVQSSIDVMESIDNKTIILNNSSTDIQYPSAKITYDTIKTSEENLKTIMGISRLI